MSHEAAPRAHRSARPDRDRLQAESLDVLVIGGGIVGAGLVRDAAMRGLRVGLVEQQDFAFGTSSRSSRLLHGGLRYLAQGRIRLVREASLEKRILHRIAPHLAEPLAFVFPTYRGGAFPLWQLRMGVKLYDLLCSGQNLGRSTALSAAQTQEAVPQLQRDGLTGAVRYFDGQTNDSRLVLDTLRSAARHGAILCNYARFAGAERVSDRWHCEIHDVENDRDYRVQAKSVISAAGPWADRLPHSTIAIRPTKGAHLVIDAERLPIRDAVVMASGKRILFALPWSERVILGTTDTDYDGPLDRVQTSPEDVNYILDVVNGSFPSLDLTTRDVRATWAGLRPLIADKRGNPSDISRSHEIHLSDTGWMEVAGGKLTTYRLMAEQAIDRIARYLGTRGSPCRTAEEPLLEPREVEEISSVTPPPVSRRAVEHYCGSEWARHLEDVMIRRSNWSYYIDHPDQVAELVSGWMAESLGWDEETRLAEVERYRSAIDPPLSRDV